MKSPFPLPRFNLTMPDTVNRSLVTFLLAEDDDGHAALIELSLRQHGLTNPILRFVNGQDLVDFLEGRHSTYQLMAGRAYLALVDIRMPKLDGVEVLRFIKNHPRWKPMPVVMLTTTDDPREVALCHELGCSSYIRKPLDYDRFTEALRRLGLFLQIVQIPTMPGS